MSAQTATASIFLDSHKILRIAGLGYGQKMADFGCGGAGHFVIEAARTVGDKGKAFAVDVMKSALSGVDSKARMYGLTSLVTVWSNVEVLGATKIIASNSLDMVTMIQLLFQSKKHDNIFKEASRVLKKGGQVVVIDWKQCNLAVSPKSGDCISAEAVQEIAARNNYKYIRPINAGPYHYGLLFEKK